MKKLIALLVLCCCASLCVQPVFAQETAPKPAPKPPLSPPATVSETLKDGIVLTINYSRPSLKNRTIGKDIAPYDKVWRTGANQATTFEINKAVKVEGKTLPAGKYSFYTIPGEKEWTIIFNKTWNQWGTVYAQDQDQLRVNVKPSTTDTSTEMLTYTISKDGKVSINWGKVAVPFSIQ